MGFCFGLLGFLLLSCGVLGFFLGVGAGEVFFLFVYFFVVIVIFNLNVWGFFPRLTYISIHNNF